MKALLALALVGAASAALLQQPRPLVGWEITGRTEGGKKLNVMLSLSKPNDRTGERIAKTADPDHPEFRNWATREEAYGLRGATRQAEVMRWLKSHGIAATVTGHAITAQMTAAQAEMVFSTTVSNVKSQATGKVWHHASDLHIPANITGAIDAVFGLHGLPLPPRAQSLKKKTLKDSPNVGPTDIRKAYHVTGRGTGSVRVRQAVAEFQGQFSNQADLSAFFQNLVPNAQTGDDQIYAYKGNQQSGDGVEALLDVQYIMGIAPGVKTEFWGWQNFDFCTDLKNWTTTILGDSNPPLVHSVSYGWQGDLSQIGCTNDEVNSIDSDLQSIAARGITIIFASGDSGSGYDGSLLYPSWPASSPWVTAVGATAFTDSTMTVEQASDQFGSGSGFSTLFNVASWQRAAVQNYFASQSGNLPPSSVWNQGGRATADVSALGEGYQVYVDGSVEIVGGTSAAAPCFAAIISLLNDKAVTNGGKPYGFLNPWIYRNPTFFRDVTLGSDKVGRDGSQLDYGFNAAPRWDPPTGMGTPIFDRMHA